MNKFASAIENARVKVGQAAAKFLTDTCTIMRPGAPSTDASGNTTETPASSSTNVPVSYAAMSVFENMTAGALGATADHKLTLPANTDVKESDTIIVDARGAVPQLTFQVTGRLDKATDLMLTVAATLQR